MMQNYWGNFSGPWTSPMGTNWGFGFGGFFILLVIWSIVWKGLALWRAARDGSKPWFVALLVINTMGILEILYLYVFSKNAKKVSSKS
ncbi:MAG: DUF5652 family protein [Candidatus Liptonbacteria bacterium]|nr:DUF5652 family protein [Candidatus Liptonbacteria bacterium]